MTFSWVGWTAHLELARRQRSRTLAHLVPGSPTMDLEGVLAPEFWVAVAEATGVEALRRTTREEADYEALMRFRLDLLDVHSITFSEIMAVVTSLAPLHGALGFLRELQQLSSSVVVVSDTFDVFADSLLDHLGRPTMMCHRLLVTDDRIVGYQLPGTAPQANRDRPIQDGGSGDRGNRRLLQ